MRNYLIVLIVIEFILGAFFLLNSATDIQLGFGLVFILMGMQNIAKVKKQ